MVTSTGLQRVLLPSRQRPLFETSFPAPKQEPSRETAGASRQYGKQDDAGAAGVKCLQNRGSGKEGNEEQGYKEHHHKQYHLHNVLSGRFSLSDHRSLFTGSVCGFHFMGGTLAAERYLLNAAIEIAPEHLSICK